MRHKIYLDIGKDMSSWPVERQNFFGENQPCGAGKAAWCHWIG